MTISQHILQLLEKHNCVIVPGFGGFIIKPTPAHLGKGTIYPPASEINFNINLKTNDGLLLNTLVAEEKISFEEAGKKIEQFVDEATQSLVDSKSYIVKKVGKIYIDQLEEIHFKSSRQTNYNHQSFGLPVLSAEEINRIALQKQQVKKVIQKTTVSPWTKVFTVAATVLTLLLAGSLYLHENGTDQEQNLIRNSIGSIFLIDNPDYIATFETEPKSVYNNYLETSTKKEVYYFKNVAKGEGDFHVIVGMFGREANANEVKEVAEKKGYHAFVEKGYKYYRIMVPFKNEHATWVEAQKMLSNDVVSDAWIWESRNK